MKKTDQKVSDAFMDACIDVLSQFLPSVVIRTEMSEKTKLYATQEVSIIVGVSGSLDGQVVYSMSVPTAIAVSSAMLGMKNEEFDELAASAISELGNIISGNASMRLYQAAYACDLTQPTIIHGKNVEIATQVPASACIIELPCGEIELNLSLSACVAVQ